MQTDEQMHIDWDVPIEMDDGVVVRADVFRPAAPGRYPVVLSHGVYGKGLPIERFRHRLHKLAESLPDNVLGADVADAVAPGSDAEVAGDDYRVWEVVDPTVWVPHGYVCVRVDSRGSGSSPGTLDPLSPREISDYAACVEWAGTRDWSNGRVGLCGKSYYAMTQWLVAARQPRHLAAICVWHGVSDWYRDATRHGGILYQFWEKFWYPELALPVQHGVGPQAGSNPHSGRPIAGEQTLSAATLAASRADIVGDLRLRGTIRGFGNVASTDRWLEVHAGGQFDDPAAVDLQRRFFDHHLKDTDLGDPDQAGDGWRRQPRVQLAVRRVDGTSTLAHACDWPLPDTEWRSYYLDIDRSALVLEPPQTTSQVAYEADGAGVELHSVALASDTTILGPVAATLWLSSSTLDADLFLVLDAVDPDGQRVELRDHRGGLTPVTVGWLRASHRATDPALSTPWQPHHTHIVEEPLVPGQPYQVEVELRPTSLQLPAGYRLRLTISGHGQAHDDPADRPAARFDNTVTLYSGPDMPAHLLVPAVPPTPADIDDDRGPSNAAA